MISHTYTFYCQLFQLSQSYYARVMEVDNVSIFFAYYDRTDKMDTILSVTKIYHQTLKQLDCYEYRLQPVVSFSFFCCL